MRDEDAIILNDADPEEWDDYDEIKVTKGLDLSGKSLQATQWIERTNAHPVTQIDTPWPNSAWRLCAERAKTKVRICPFPALQESKGWAWFFFDSLYKSGVEGRRPAHEVMQFMDMMRATSKEGKVDQEAMRCVHEVIYDVHNNEFLGRGVG